MTVLLDVLGLDPSDSIVRVVAFALPAAVFLTLLVLLRVKARSKSNKAGVLEHVAPDADRESEPIAPARMPDAPLRAVLVPPASAPSDIGRADEAATIERSTVAVAPKVDATSHAPVALLQTPEHAPAAAPAQPVMPAAPAPVSTSAEPAVEAPAAPLGFDSIKAQFEEAVKSAPKTALAPLYLEYASQCRKSGDEAACLAALRSAAGFGALHGPRVAHAAARVELAEVAYMSGDAIGACEQWQIARLVLHEEGLKDAYARIDKRMRDNGCPTDWVLTDF